MLLKVHVVTLEICPGPKTAFWISRLLLDHVCFSVCRLQMFDWIKTWPADVSWLELSQQYCVTGGGETWSETSVASFHLLENKAKVTSTKIFYYFIKTHTQGPHFTFDRAELDCSWLGLSRLGLGLVSVLIHSGLGLDLVRLVVLLEASDTVLIIGIIMLNTLHLTF